MALTPQQERFVTEYLVDLNATQAAIRSGYSERSAYSQGQRLLKNDEIAAEIVARNKKRIAKAELSADRVLDEIRAMAFWDPADLVEIMRLVTPAEFERMDDAKRGGRLEVGGNIYTLDGIYAPRDIKLLPEPIRRAIVGWSWDRNNNFTLKLADKSKALDQLARHLGLFHDKLEITVDYGDRLQRARERREARLAAANENAGGSQASKRQA